MILESHFFLGVEFPIGDGNFLSVIFICGGCHLGSVLKIVLRLVSFPS